MDTESKRKSGAVPESPPVVGSDRFIVFKWDGLYEIRDVTRTKRIVAKCRLGKDALLIADLLEKHHCQNNTLHVQPGREAGGS